MPVVGGAEGAEGAGVVEQRGVPYLVEGPGGRGVPPSPGVPRLWGRAAPARAVGTGWLSLEERREPWPALTSALAPKSVPGLQGSGSGSVPTLVGEDFGEQREPQEPGPWGVPGAAQRHPPWWQHHGLWWVLVAKDSLGCPGTECWGSPGYAPPPATSPAPPGEGKG